MARLSLSFKTLNSLHIFSMKAPSSSSSSSSLSSMKLKTPIQAFIFSHMYRITRVFAKAKSLLLELLVEFPVLKMKNKNMMFMNKHKKLSFRLHYNWCASHHVLPLSQEPYSYSNSHVYYDASWNTTLNCHHAHQDQPTLMESDDELSRYLEWLEDRKNNIQESNCCNEIDKLADLFIANCHEKFRLEKQESYRRFQEMMARSV